MQVVHFTTVHPRDDSRIRAKMMVSLQMRYPGCVTLFVKDGRGGETDRSGFQIVDTGPRMGRLRRMSLGAFLMVRAVWRARPTIAHFHDPELLPWAILLRLRGIKVVYDVHEDYPEAVSHNYRLPAAARRLIPPVVRLVEWLGARFLNGIVAVTPQIAGRFQDSKTVMVRNWPLIGEYHRPSERPMRDRPAEVAYIGTITLNRNIIGMLDALVAVQDRGVVLRLAGHFTVGQDEVAARQHSGWGQVRFDGWVSRDGVADILGSVRAGLVVLRPVAHEMLTYPIKLFEYMAAGLPVIASDFPLWRQIVEGPGCGLLVDPEDPGAIAAAIRWVVEHPDDAAEMGARGRQAVLEQYNWTEEAGVLFALYDRLVGDAPHSHETKPEG